MMAAKNAELENLQESIVKLMEQEMSKMKGLPIEKLTETIKSLECENARLSEENRKLKVKMRCINLIARVSEENIGEQLENEEDQRLMRSLETENSSLKLDNARLCEEIDKLKKSAFERRPITENGNNVGRKRRRSRSRSRGRDSCHQGSKSRSLSPDSSTSGSRSPDGDERQRSRSRSTSRFPLKKKASPYMSSPSSGESPTKRSPSQQNSDAHVDVVVSVSPPRESACSHSLSIATQF